MSTRRTRNGHRVSGDGSVYFDASPWAMVRAARRRRSVYPRRYKRTKHAIESGNRKVLRELFADREIVVDGAGPSRHRRRGRRTVNGHTDVRTTRQLYHHPDPGATAAGAAAVNRHWRQAVRRTDDDQP